MGRALPVMFVVLLCDLVSFSIILPLLPGILAHYKEGDSDSFSSLVGWAHSLRPLYFSSTASADADIVLANGLIGSVSALLQLISSFLFGRVADRFGRRPAALACEAGTVAAIALWFFSGHLTPFIASRALAGVSRGLTQLSHTVAADVSSDLGRTRAMAVIGAAFSLGFVIGPLIGALLVPRSVARLLPPAVQSFAGQLVNTTGNPLAFPAFVSLAIAALGMLTALVALPETKKWVDDSKDAAAAAAAGEASAAIDAQRNKSAERRLRWTHCAFLAIFAGTEFNLTFFTAERFGFTPADNGKLLALIGIVAAVLQGGYVRRFKQIDEVRRLCGTSMIALMLSLVMLAFSVNSTWAVMATLLFAFASAVGVPTLTALLSIVATEEARGTSIGTFRAYGLFGRAVGPLFCSFLYFSFGPAIAFTTLAALTCGPMLLLDLAARFMPAAAKDTVKND